MLTIGSLFSGIGGLELGLERAGIGPVRWQVEKSKFCRSILERHWPDAKRYDDVRFLPKSIEPVDLICGGFPCVEISSCGKKGGMVGDSALWDYFAEVVRHLRPRYVVVENVAALAARGLGRVLGHLAEFGYDAEWSVLPACAVGAPYPRKRLFVVAYANEYGQPARPVDAEVAVVQADAGSDWNGWDRSTGPDGVATRVRTRVHDRAQAIGNAVVPQVAEVVGRVVRAIHESMPVKEAR